MARKPGSPPPTPGREGPIPPAFYPRRPEAHPTPPGARVGPLKPGDTSPPERKGPHAGLFLVRHPHRRADARPSYSVDVVETSVGFIAHIVRDGKEIATMPPHANQAQARALATNHIATLEDARLEDARDGG